jgi:hypothetical protein
MAQDNQIAKQGRGKLMQPLEPGPQRNWNRGVLLTVLGAAALLLVLKALERTRAEAAQDVALHFRVVNARTGRPLPGAIIRLFSDGTIVRDLHTGSNGEAETREPCEAATPTMFFARRGSVALPPWSFLVSREGYQMSNLQFVTDQTGPTRSQNDSLALPTMEVRLSPQRAPLHDASRVCRTWGGRSLPFHGERDTPADAFFTCRSYQFTISYSVCSTDSRAR